MPEQSDLFAEEGPDEVEETETKLSDKAIEKQFSEGRLRVIQEKNDFFLIHIVDFIRGLKWGNLRPDYQRRLRWDTKKKSRLIESFVMNVPVPPVFLFEDKPGEYEVMDGQQRLNTIAEFLENEFELRGLAIWRDLNGRRFKQLPPLIRGSLERAKLSAITLITDPTTNENPDIDLRAQVFDRLNTGGEKLNPQELRNSLFSGPFNRMIREVAALPNFTKAWDIPNHAENVHDDGSETEELRNNNLYKRMLDCEIALRFFAFREPKKITGSVRSILDRCMKDNRHAQPNEIESLKQRFEASLQLATNVFGDAAFRIFVDGSPSKLSRPLFDAEMIAFDRNLVHAERLVERRAQLVERVKEITHPDSSSYPLIVGRANTADAIKERIDLVSDIFRDVVK